MLAKLSFSSVSKFVVPAAVTAAAIGTAYHFSTYSSIYNESGKTFKGDNEWVDLKLKKTEELSNDTKKFFFELLNKDDVSGLVTASCVLAKYVTPKGSNVIRPYTPISDINEKGIIEFVIKVYPEGKMGNHVAGLKEGETLSFKGPLVKWKYEPNSFKEVVLIGGGSGITPLYQLVHTITKDPSDKTKVKLFYGNKTEKDILIKKELDELAKKYPEKFEVVYFLDSAPSGWSGKTGFISKDYLSTVLPPPAEKGLKIFVCGPPPLYKAISGDKVSPQDQGELTGALADLGYSKDQVFKF